MTDKIIFNVSTGEQITVPLSQEDIDLIEQANIESIQYSNEISQQINENKNSAIEKLKQLGLTEEEAKAIAGI